MATLTTTMYDGYLCSWGKETAYNTTKDFITKFEYRCNLTAAFKLCKAFKARTVLTDFIFFKQPKSNKAFQSEFFLSKILSIRTLLTLN